VATQYRENAVGEETAREAVVVDGSKGLNETTAAKRSNSGEERKVKRGQSEKVKLLGTLTR
jgi:hypothetical protein